MAVDRGVDKAIDQQVATLRRRAGGQQVAGLIVKTEFQIGDVGGLVRNDAGRLAVLQGEAVPVVRAAKLRLHGTTLRRSTGKCQEASVQVLGRGLCIVGCSLIAFRFEHRIEVQGDPITTDRIRRTVDGDRVGARLRGLDRLDQCQAATTPWRDTGQQSLVGIAQRHRWRPLGEQAAHGKRDRLVRVQIDR